MLRTSAETAPAAPTSRVRLEHGPRRRRNPPETGRIACVRATLEQLCPESGDSERFSAVPAIVGVAFVVVLPSAGAVTTGAAGASVSTVKLLGVDTGLVLPAGSVAAAVTVCKPSLNGAAGVQLQLPSAFAVVVQSGTPPSLTVTLLFGSAVPPMMGVLSLVCVTGVVTLGAAGAVLSTLKFCAAAGPVLPAGSVAATNTVCGPLLSAVVGVQLQVPPAPTTAVQSVTPPSFTVMVLPGSAVPLNVGVVSLTTWLGVGALTTGVAGGVLSTVIGRVLAGPVLPAGSVAVALSVCAPSLRAKGGVQVQLPLASTTALQITGPPAPSVTLTVLPGSPVPLTVGVVSLKMLPAVGAMMAGAMGAVESIVTGTLVAGLVLPAGSVAVVLSVCGPSDNAVVGVQLQLPLALATAVQSTGPLGPSRTVTVLPGSAEPVRVGVVSLIGLPAVGELTVGAAGATVSTVNGRVVGGLVLPAGSVAVTANACAPSVRGVVAVQTQLPLASAMAVQIGTPPSLT